MGVMAMLEQAQGGKLFEHVAASLDIDETHTRKSMGKLCPAIAEALHEKARNDEDLFESLLDLIEDGAEASPLDEPEALTDAEAMSDGNEILEDVYGSRNDAMVALRKVSPSLPERELQKLAPISATAVVAALAQANKPLAAAALPAGEQPAQESGMGGIIGTIVGAVIAGAVSGAMRELTSAKRWRGTTGYSRAKTKRKTSKSKTTSRKRRSTTSSGADSVSGGLIEDIFRKILIGK
jgi:hypothetical protein